MGSAREAIEKRKAKAREKLRARQGEHAANDVESGQEAPPPAQPAPKSFSFQASMVGIYVFIWVSHGLLIRASQVEVGGEAKYLFSFLAVTLVTDFCKLCLATGLFLYGPSTANLGSVEDKIKIAWDYRRTGMYFIVTAFIYAMYNNLMFLNFIYFDVGTYKVLMNSRILFTGLLFQYFFKRQLGTRKWVGLLLLMLGCGFLFVDKIQSGTTMVAVMLISFQSACSSLAGVYNEYLLKKDVSIDVNLQNFYHNMLSMVCNFVFMLILQPGSLAPSRFFENWSGWTLLIVVNGMLGGFITSIILKFLSVIVKAYATSTEMVLSALLANFFFQQSLPSTLLLSMAFVIASIYVYNVEPKKDNSSS